jgi:hypothetical protein
LIVVAQLHVNLPELLDLTFVEGFLSQEKSGFALSRQGFEDISRYVGECVGKLLVIVAACALGRLMKLASRQRFEQL